MTMPNWRELPVLHKNERLIFQDTASKPVPGQPTLCLLCARPFIMRKHLGAPDQICPDCYEVYKDCAVVICKRCNVVICRIIPKVLESGYYIQPKSVLHSDKCNVCSPGLTQSTIIEIAEWERHHRPSKLILPPSVKKHT